MTSTLGGEYLNQQHYHWHTYGISRLAVMPRLIDDTDQNLVQCCTATNPAKLHKLTCKEARHTRMRAVLAAASEDFQLYIVQQQHF